MSVEVSSPPAVAAAFRALADPTRLRILEILRGCPREVEIDEAGKVRPAGSLSVGEVCCDLEQQLSTVSHHLRELRLAGLIHMERRGRSVFCWVDEEALAALREFLAPGGVLGGRCG